MTSPSKSAQRLIELDRQIAAKKAAIAQQKNELYLLDIERAKFTQQILGVFPEGEKKLDVGEVRFTRRTHTKVILKEHVTVSALPDMLIRKSPDKAAIAKVAKSNPKLTESFADIETTESLTYKII